MFPPAERIALFKQKLLRLHLENPRAERSSMNKEEEASGTRVLLYIFHRSPLRGFPDTAHHLQAAARHPRIAGKVVRPLRRSLWPAPASLAQPGVDSVFVLTKDMHLPLLRPHSPKASPTAGSGKGPAPAGTGCAREERSGCTGSFWHRGEFQGNPHRAGISGLVNQKEKSFSYQQLQKPGKSICCFPMGGGQKMDPRPPPPHWAPPGCS